MHQLTNNDADRLARDLDAAAQYLHQLANIHGHYSSGLEVTGQTRWADYHAREAEQARSWQLQLRTYADRLTERQPLWDKDSRPSQHRARLPKSSRRRNGDPA